MVDNVEREQIEDLLFGIRYEVQELKKEVGEQSANIVKLSQGLDHNIRVLMGTIEGLQNDVLQMRLILSEKKGTTATGAPVLTPRTKVMTDEELQTQVRTSESPIKWDQRPSEEVPEESFGFRIPNTVNEE